MIVGSVAAILLGGADRGIKFVQEIPAKLPPFNMPELTVHNFRILASNAFAVALLGLIEAVAIARAIGTKTHQRIDGNQEFIGQGLSNVVGSFFSSYAGSGSFTRSGVNHTAGAHTPMSAIFAAIILAVFLLLLFGVFSVINSRMGLAFVALRDAEHFAKSLGINEHKFKLTAFGLSASITGIMGGFYSHYVGSISPAMLGTELFLTVLAMVLFGGLGKFPGAAMGAFAITFASEFLRPFGTFRLLLLGGIIVTTMLYMPKGLMGLLESVKGRINAEKRKGGT